MLLESAGKYDIARQRQLTAIAQTGEHPPCSLSRATSSGLTPHPCPALLSRGRPVIHPWNSTGKALTTVTAAAALFEGNTCVVGLQWGDEGKGKIVDFLTESAEVVVRYCGGANAGHNRPHRQRKIRDATAARRHLPQRRDQHHRQRASCSTRCADPRDRRDDGARRGDYAGDAEDQLQNASRDAVSHARRRRPRSGGRQGRQSARRSAG